MPIIRQVVYSDGAVKTTLRQKLKEIKPFLSDQQFATISDDITGADYEFTDVVDRLYAIITTMPTTSLSSDNDETMDNEESRDSDESQDNEELMVCLHYFMDRSEWFIIQKDARDGLQDKQHRAFGYAILNGDLQNAELGYISIEVLRNLNTSQSTGQTMGVEIDFHFEPTTLSGVKKRLEKRYGDANVNGDANGNANDDTNANGDANEESILDEYEGKDEGEPNPDEWSNELSLTQFVTDFGDDLLKRVAEQAPALFNGTYPNKWDKVDGRS